MKTIFTLASRLATQASIAAVASVCLLVAVPAEAGIANTKHNLGAKGTGENHLSTGTDEICVFCHTPHAADNTAPVPLWNKALPTNSASKYKTYATLGSSTLDGKVLDVGSISLACLSCHDGTQAMDNIINAPGPGGYDKTGGGVDGLGWTWQGARVDATGKLINATNTLAMLDTDLSNDHPIGIQYCGGGPNINTPTGACVDPDFVAPSTRQINGNTVWWVDTAAGTPSAREKTDMILYTRDFNTAAAGTTANGVIGPSVECGSCHDPHIDPTDSPKAGQTFLRIANNESKVCLACHVK